MTAPAAKKPAPKKTKKPAASKDAAGVVARVSYSQEVCDAICAQLAEGNSLRAICEAPDMPSVTSVMRWLADEDKAAFREQYARAREAQADRMAEDILTIADEEVTMVKRSKHGGAEGDDSEVEVVFDPTAVARNRLRVDARKWLASKMAPKKYGDKLGLGGADGLDPVGFVSKEMTDAERAVRLSRLLAGNPAALSALLGKGAA